MTDEGRERAEISAVSWQWSGLLKSHVWVIISYFYGSKATQRRKRSCDSVIR